MKRKADAVVRTYEFGPAELSQLLGIEGEVLTVEMRSPSRLGDPPVIWIIKTTEVQK